ncbi:MAG: cell division protein ZapA [Bryobacteraceae bacterium]
MDSGTPEKKPVRVTIFHQQYTLLASGEPGETERLANMVDDLMSTIASRAGNADSGRIAVLASLHLADQLRSAERELSRLKEEIHEKSQRLARLLDHAIQNGG